MRLRSRLPRNGQPPSSSPPLPRRSEKVCNAAFEFCIYGLQFQSHLYDERTAVPHLHGAPLHFPLLLLLLPELLLHQLLLLLTHLLPLLVPLPLLLLNLKLLLYLLLLLSGELLWPGQTGWPLMSL